MYIHEAIAETRRERSSGIFIRRTGWPYNKMHRTGYMIRPTNAPGGCVAYSFDLPAEKWVPTAADLMADDWEVC